MPIWKKMEKDKTPKMPKFNMNWIYGLVIVGLLAVYFAGGDAVAGSAS